MRISRDTKFLEQLRPVLFVLYGMVPLLTYVVFATIEVYYPGSTIGSPWSGWCIPGFATLLLFTVSLVEMRRRRILLRVLFMALLSLGVFWLPSVICVRILRPSLFDEIFSWNPEQLTHLVAWCRYTLVLSPGVPLYTGTQLLDVWSRRYKRRTFLRLLFMFVSMYLAAGCALGMLAVVGTVPQGQKSDMAMYVLFLGCGVSSALALWMRYFALGIDDARGTYRVLGTCIIFLSVSGFFMSILIGSETGYFLGFVSLLSFMAGYIMVSGGMVSSRGLFKRWADKLCLMHWNYVLSVNSLTPLPEHAVLSNPCTWGETTASEQDERRVFLKDHLSRSRTKDISLNVFALLGTAISYMTNLEKWTTLSDHPWTCVMLLCVAAATLPLAQGIRATYWRDLATADRRFTVMEEAKEAHQHN